WRSLWGEDHVTYSTTGRQRGRSRGLALLAALSCAGCGSSDISSFSVNPDSPDDTITGDPGTPGGVGVLVADDAGVGSSALDLVNQLPSSVGPNSSVSLSQGGEIAYPNGVNANTALQISVEPPIVIGSNSISILNLSPQQIGCNDAVPTACTIPAGAVLIPTGSDLAPDDYEFTYNFQSVNAAERTVVRRFLTVRDPSDIEE
ncbi:MAG: hypothetical protein AAFY15_13755, partial [Cyanobacteria bacterium J06648_11]